MRKYINEPPDFADVIPATWFKEGKFTTIRWYAYWVKDGKESKDNAFITPQLDATHVAIAEKP